PFEKWMELGMRATRLAMYALVLSASAACRSDAPRTATTLSASATDLAFDALGARDTVRLTAADVNGASISGFAPQSAVQSGNVDVKVLASDDLPGRRIELVAVRVGDDQVNLSVGTASLVLSVSVRQVPRIELASGDGQSGHAGRPLDNRIVVRVT